MRGFLHHVVSQFQQCRTSESRLAIRLVLADERVLSPFHEQPGDQVRLPIAGHGFGLDAFDLKDRDVLKQPPQCITGTSFRLFH